MIPSALEHVQKIARSGERLAVFLDYDGTLTPIVSHPENAWLPDSMRETLRSLASRVPVAILSGRDLDDVRGRVLEKRGVAILVSEHPQVTAANYCLNNPEEVERFLQKITDRLHATEL